MPSSMGEALRQEWKSELSWKQVFTLRDRLDDMLEEIRTSRNIGLRRCGARFARRTLGRCRRGSRFERSYSRLVVSALSVQRKLSHWRSAGQSTARKTVSTGMASSLRHYPNLPPLTGRTVTRTILPYYHTQLLWCHTRALKIEKAYRWMKDLSSAPTSAGRDRPRGVREIGRRNRRCLTASGMLTSWGSW